MVVALPGLFSYLFFFGDDLVFYFLSTIFKTYRDKEEGMMKGSLQRSVIQSGSESAYLSLVIRM